MAKVAERPIWKAKGEEKRERVRQMFADIAPSYDRMNSIISLRRHYAWRRLAVRAIDVRPGERALDVCCGTGDFFAPLLDSVGPEGSVTGLDFCREMLDVAKSKFGEDVDLVQGDACALPFENESLDVVTVGWGLRNVPDLALAIREAGRVLKQGGRFVSLDMCRPEGRLYRALAGFAFRKGVPLLGSLVGHGEAYRYLPESVEEFESPEQVAALMRDAGMNDAQFRRMYLGNIVMHWGTKA